MPQQPEPSVPSKIFVVPYRDRPIQRATFIKHMLEVLLVDEPVDSYKILFANQCDKRPFNRGAMKNLGFLAVKRMYPVDYKNITIIFHDVDTYPAYKGLVDYDTATMGSVSHYYGYNFALGGIVGIKGEDFLKSKGFPNFWGWGLEDNLLNKRCLAAGLTINRDCFYQIRDPLIIRLFDGFIKNCFRREAVIYKHEKPDDMFDLKNIKMSIITLEDSRLIDVNITQFTCNILLDEQDMCPYDIRITNKIKIDQRFRRRVWKMNKMFSNNNT